MRPERARLWQRFGLKHIKIGAGQIATDERFDQEETREMPATGLRHTWKHGASVVIGVLILTAFFVFIGG